MPFADPSCQAETKNKMVELNFSGILFLLTACHLDESKSNSKNRPCRHHTFFLLLHLPHHPTRPGNLPLHPFNGVRYRSRSVKPKEKNPVIISPKEIKRIAKVSSRLTKKQGYINGSCLAALAFLHPST